MEIQLNRLQCRTFQRYAKKIDFERFSLEDTDDGQVIIRLTDSNGWEIAVWLDQTGRGTYAEKRNINEDQQIQSQNT
jgi:hypothetical protein